jgi:hypothetical protein
MNRDDITRMAREAGFVGFDGDNGSLRRFAALVAAAEREACAKLCEDEAWRLKQIALDTESETTNTRAVQAFNDAVAIRARGKQ